MAGESIDRYFRLIYGVRDKKPSGRLWCPAADVYRTRDGWIVKVDLAGISADDLQITLHGSTLELRGLRRDSSYAEGITYQQLEITYSRFEKRIQFPSSIEKATLERDYRDGLLVLKLVEAEEG
ncbi:MAG: Hsp20/alpha crystallin family protein [Pyrinomonadaceae bacterium]